MIDAVRIPEDRKPAVLGSHGRTKAKIEKATGTKIDISDIVEISGDDPIMLLKARDIVTAIGRGFSLAQAMRLLEDDCLLRVISLEGESEKKRIRLFGRVIGKGGKSKGVIEKETGALLCIKGKTLSILGMREEVEPAEEAVETLLSGKTHGYAYKRMLMKKEKDS